jgi:catechol 2,3-dioxygenase-like lactoylglutathione lyase family enzyme
MTTTPRCTTGHVGLNVSDLTRAVRFYSEVFGFEVLADSDGPGREFAFLGHAGNPVLTLWRQSTGNAATDRPGLHHLSFQVDSPDAVRDAEVRLRALGAVIHHGGIVAHREGADSGGLFFEDPDGIRLEIFAATGAKASPAPYAEGPTCGFF